MPAISSARMSTFLPSSAGRVHWGAMSPGESAGRSKTLRGLQWFGTVWTICAWRAFVVLVRRDRMMRVRNVGLHDRGGGLDPGCAEWSYTATPNPCSGPKKFTERGRDAYVEGLDLQGRVDAADRPTPKANLRNPSRRAGECFGHSPAEASCHRGPSVKLASDPISCSAFRADCRCHDCPAAAPRPVTNQLPWQRERDRLER